MIVQVLQVYGMSYNGDIIHSKILKVIHAVETSPQIPLMEELTTLSQIP